MSIGDLFDGAFKLYRANFKVIALVALVIAGPVQVLAALSQRNANGGRGIVDLINDPTLVDQAQRSNGSGAQLLTAMIGILAGFLIGPLVAGAVARAVSLSYLGQQITAREALTAAARRWLPLLAASFLVHLTEGVAFVLCLSVIFLMPLWVVVSPAIVVEGLGPIAGMQRSVALIKRRYWPTMGRAYLSGGLTYVLSGMITAIPTTIAVLIGFRWGFLFVAVGGIATSVLIAPLTPIVATLIYFDLRIRTEGFDLELLAGRSAPLPAG